MARVWLTGLGKGKPEMALVFPAGARIGADNLGLHAAFRGLSRIGFVDIFFPDAEGGMISARPLYEFPLIFFSGAYEPDYLTGLRFLRREGIELDRRRRAFHTLIAGGIAPSANPFPLWHTFDAVLVGEAEAILPEIEGLLMLGRDEILSGLAEFPFAWVPGSKESASRAWLRDISDTDAYSAFIEKSSFFRGEFLVEVVRGCPTRCRFCLLGFSRLPPRFLDPDAVLSLLAQLPEGLTDRVGLVGSAVAEHPGLTHILEKAPPYLKINPSSVNIQALDRDLLELMARRGASTLTVAPETASEPLRKRLNKDFSNDKLMEIVERARHAGFGSLKLYYMVGLPWETDDDVAAIGQQITEAKRVFKKRVRATVSPFVPKAGTPFHRAPFISEREYKRKKGLVRVPPDVHLRFHGYRKARQEAILSRGDARVSLALLEAAEEGSGFAAGLRRAGVVASVYLDDPGYPLSAPYLRVDSGVSPAYLNAEWERARKGVFSGPCSDMCRACGICGEEE